MFHESNYLIISNVQVCFFCNFCIIHVNLKENILSIETMPNPARKLTFYIEHCWETLGKLNPFIKLFFSESKLHIVICLFNA